MDGSGSTAMRVMIFGAGYSGMAIGNAFAKAGHRAGGTTRTQTKFPPLERAGITPYIYGGAELPHELSSALGEVTHLVQSIAPGPDGDPLLRALSTDIGARMPQLKWIGYLSTVGVYGDHGGGWVDEDTACKPVSVRSVERVTAEQAWQAAADARNVPLAVLRLSGIYGPGRNAFRNLDNGIARRLVKKDQVFNRIRAEDIAAATLFLCERGLGGIFNVTDGEPCPPQDVVLEAARLMGVAPPPEQSFETAELSAMARSFYGENKRVSNARLRDLGFGFAYPDYRASLAQLWRDGTWNHSLDTTFTP